MATIKFSNNVLLNSVSIQSFIDTSNSILSSQGNSNYSWTATQDCYVFISCGDNNANDVKIDNTPISLRGGNTGTVAHYSFLIRKNQKVEVWANNGNRYDIKAFGLK